MGHILTYAPKFTLTAHQFKKKHKLKKLPELLGSELPKYGYMAYFKLEGKYYSYCTYGPPGYIKEIKADEIPQDLISRLI